jgi:hypothetical protein
LKKAIRIVSGGSDPPSNKGSTFSVASQLTGSGVMSASVLLPGDPSRRSSMPVLPTSSGGGGASGFIAELFDRHRSQKIPAGSIIASVFEFRGPADSSFLMEQHGGRQHPPPHRLRALLKSSRPKLDRTTVGRDQEVPFDPQS